MPPLSINPKDGSILVQIPAGEFEMGDGKSSNNPKHKVHLDMYYIGVYAVTNRQYKRFVEQTGHRTPNHWKKNAYPEDLEDHPVAYVSWEDAQAYCSWAGLSLPAEAQWEKAARGPARLLYPWGNDWDGSKCRHDGNRASETTCFVYDYAPGISGYGAYNLSGNMWEWCLDWYEGDYYKDSPNSNPTGPSSGSIRVVRGGGWNGVVGSCRSAYRNNFYPAVCSDNVGFRVVLAPGQQR